MTKILSGLLLFSWLTSFSSVLGQNMEKGGFTYGWDNYDQSFDLGLGDRTYNFDTTGLRMIEHAPEIGIHPRVYFGPNEVPDIANRLANLESGQQVKAQLRAFTILLNNGYSGYNQNASYALDSYGNRYIDNSGAWDMNPHYEGLKNHDPNVWDNVPLKQKHRTASLMAAQAFLTLIFPNEFDAELGVTFGDLASEVIDAMDFWATLAINDPATSPSLFNNFGGTHMALCYDFLYNYMTTAQRDNIRAALAMCIPSEPLYGKGLTAFANTSNWTTLNSFEIVMNLAIEGETGYQANLTHDWMRALHNFINYGWYPSGAGYEGIGKNYQFVTTLIVCAKRGYSLLGHPHVRAFGEDFLNAITQPYGSGFTGYDVWAGSGFHPDRGKYKFNAADAVGLKWIFPNNPKIDFMWRNYIDGTASNDSRGYVYSHVGIDDSYNNYLIPAAIFAQNYSNEGWQACADQVVNEHYFADDRGLGVFKSSTDSLGLAMQFHARQDLGGHTHGDRLDFTLSGLGRIWIRKTYGGSQFHTSKYHSMVLVDDLGVSLTDLEGDKSRQPAKVLNCEYSNNLSKMSGDATYAYSWEWSWWKQLPSDDNPWLGTNGWEAVTETWNDFQYIPQPEPHYNVSFYDYPHWSDPDRVERALKRPYNPMDKVIRNVGMIRGEKPFALIVDDIQKDGDVHNYKWLGQLARDLELDYYDVNLSDDDYRCDIVLKEPSSLGNRRLLVRVLENTGYDGTTNPGYIDTLDYIDEFNGNPFNPNPNWVRPRLIIESNSVSPNFKVLLFPFEAGEGLPITNWNASRDTLEVDFFNETHIVHFYTNDDNYDDFELVNNEDTSGLKEVDSFNAYLFPNPSNGWINIQSKEPMQSVALFELNGKRLQEWENVNETQIELILNDRPAGSYLLNIRSINGASISKIVNIQ